MEVVIIAIFLDWVLLLGAEKCIGSRFHVIESRAGPQITKDTLLNGQRYVQSFVLEKPE